MEIKLLFLPFGPIPPTAELESKPIWRRLCRSPSHTACICQGNKHVALFFPTKVQNNQRILSKGFQIYLRHVMILWSWILQNSQTLMNTLRKSMGGAYSLVESESRWVVTSWMQNLNKEPRAFSPLNMVNLSMQLISFQGISAYIFG